MAGLARYITPTLLIPLAVLTAIFCFIGCYWQTVSPRKGSLEYAPLRPRPARLSFPAGRHPMERKDALPLLLITAVYAFTAFFQLGSLSAPQSALDLKGGETVELELSQTVYLTKFRYYPGLGTGSYNIEISSDGEHWSTLWTRTEKDQWDQDVTVYYWADAEDFDPSYALPQKYSDLFKWLEIEPDNPQNVRYIRITGKADWSQSLLELGELALYSSTGESRDPQGLLNLSAASQTDRNGGDLTGILVTGGDALFDEQDTVPETLSWYNSSYFDEIYHPRTAYEHIRGVYPYEVSHPPLGKLIISLSVRMFGMTPFGWRFMGALFGVLMLPLLYVFLKNLFGKTAVAACGTALFAFDFMHLTQTRLATIDTYAVFFVLGMYFFLYRFLTLPAGTPFKKCALPLFLSGLFWGVGAASKWTVIYGGVGLAVLYFIGLYFKCRDWPRAAAGDETVPARRGPWLAAVIAFSVLCFVLIPAVIYTASYLPYAQARGVDLSLTNTLKGFGDDLPVLLQNLWGRFTAGEDFQPALFSKDSLSGIMLDNQWYMLDYHQGVTSTHPYSSRWFQWIVDARPILYYMDNTVAGHTVRFAAFNNPVVCWTGLLAILCTAARVPRRRWSKAALMVGMGAAAALMTWRVERGENGLFSPDLPPEELNQALAVFALCLVLYLILAALAVIWAPRGGDGRALFILVGWLSQLAPWMLIGRTTFEYHYFPSLIFLVLAICYLMDAIIDRSAGGRWKLPVYGLTAGAVAAYALFYPVLIGLQVPTWYTKLLQWLPSWPL